MEIIDITMPMGDWVFPGDKPLKLVGPYSAIGEDMEFCYEIHTCSVEGTHVQVPHYVLKDGKKLDNFDISYFRREAVLINLKNFSELIISKEVLEKELNIYNLANKAVIFYTGIMDKLLEGQDEKDKLLSMEGAEYLISKGVKMIVTDTTCLDDPVVTPDTPVTHKLMSKDFVLVKQVCNLGSVTKQEVIVEAYPLKIKEISGSPCRAVVLC